MTPRTSAEQRRERIARAAWTVMSERGLSAVSVRSIAAEAGLSVGSLQNTFPTRADLIVHAAELMIRRVVERVAAEDQEGDPIEVTLRIFTHLLPLTPESRVEMDVNVALIAESRALPQLEEIRDEAHRALAAGCRRAIDRIAPGTADDEANRRAARLHALTDGIALHLLHTPADGDRSWALEMLRSELEDLARA
ncbi:MULTISPECIES: TetR/AcrR family transcriptional regulator [unclassified Leucobacter]|uniref:TetR/AcrR family transcriptional regulator n=1 Tax=unclassified Leucobacter TaxID=2621730 RepID=UPI0006224B44|nr:TetR family transcriptional regulator C-terminal domain-containing protein [Leucobacter sp. Ag1]KKI21426.1 hypothetical protein XM48_05165 [Leucobacter sp. Ag1]